MLKPKIRPEIPLLYNHNQEHPDPEPQPSIFNFTTGSLLTARLPFSDNNTPDDGCFNITIGPGFGNFISKQLYESIPASSRPWLHVEDRSSIYAAYKQSHINSLGEICMPIVFCEDMPDYSFQVTVRAHVLDVGDELDGMFIGTDAPWISTASINDGYCYVTCDLGMEGVRTLKGELVGAESLGWGALWTTAVRWRCT